MKFDQLIECNMRILFLKKPYSKYGVEANPNTFPKNNN